MSISRLVWIVLLTSGIAAADQGPLSHRGDWALGVALPSSGGSSFSLWKIRSPTTAVGLEVGVSWSYADSTLNADAPNPTTLQIITYRYNYVLLSSTIVRCTTESPLLRTAKSQPVFGAVNGTRSVYATRQQLRQYRAITGFGSRMVPIPTHQLRRPDRTEPRLPLRAVRY